MKFSEMGPYEFAVLALLFGISADCSHNPLSVIGMGASSILFGCVAVWGGVRELLDSSPTTPQEAT